MELPKVGGVGHRRPKFWGCPDTHDITHSDCAYLYVSRAETTPRPSRQRRRSSRRGSHAEPGPVGGTCSVTARPARRGLRSRLISPAARLPRYHRLPVGASWLDDGVKRSRLIIVRSVSPKQFPERLLSVIRPAGQVVPTPSNKSRSP